MRLACGPTGHRHCMPYSARTRDRFRLAVAAVTGLTTVAALSVTGWLAGTAADGYQADQARTSAEVRSRHQAQRAERQAWRRAVRAHEVAVRNAARRPRVVLLERPQRSRVTLRYVQGATSVAPGPGGQVTSQAPSTTPPPSSVPAPPPPAPAAPPAAAPPPPPPPPPPAPAPAPSSGS